MLQSIKNTLLRLSAKIFGFNPIDWYPALLEGLAIEAGRVRDFRNKILSAVVPNENMDPDTLDDHNQKYGIPLTLAGTDAEKRARIIEKAALTGWPGPEWLQDQIQKAGFPLYVHENREYVADSTTRRYGGFQYSTFTQYGPYQKEHDPNQIPGKLVVGSPPGGKGRLYLNQWGDMEWGDFEYGSPDPNSLNPQPIEYERTTDEKYWVFYFILSPFEDRLAVDSSEFLSITQSELDYLCSLIIGIKLMRNWCILQAKAV
jgi:hypothetical protein